MGWHRMRLVSHWFRGTDSFNHSVSKVSACRAVCRSVKGGLMCAKSHGHERITDPQALSKSLDGISYAGGWVMAKIGVIWSRFSGGVRLGEKSPTCRSVFSMTHSQNFPNPPSCHSVGQPISFARDLAIRSHDGALTYMRINFSVVAAMSDLRQRLVPYTTAWLEHAAALWRRSALGQLENLAKFSDGQQVDAWLHNWRVIGLSV